MTPVHIVAASALVINTNDEVLMIRSPRRGWEIPGGQIEEGETLIAGVQREVLEETGITVQIGAMTGVYSNLTPPTKVIFNFLATYLDGTLTPSSESPEVAWVARDSALARVTHPALRDRITDGLAFVDTPVYCAYTSPPYIVHDHPQI